MAETATDTAPGGPGIACFGAINRDLKALAVAPVTWGSSNPVRLYEADGGVARNVAENLARLGATVDLIARVGADDVGAGIVARLAATGVGTDRIQRSDGASTATYTALLAPDGDLAVAFSDMAILDEWTADSLTAVAATLPARAVWFLDANLSADGLAALQAARPRGTILAADTVSVAKAPRLRTLLPHLDILFTNQAELAALTGRPVNAPLEAVEAAATIRALGTGTVVVAMGPTGVFLTADSVEDFETALPATVRDVTGAGDALVAATLFALAAGEGPTRSVRFGLAAAATTVEVTQTVHPDLSPDALRQRADLPQVA